MSIAPLCHWRPEATMKIGIERLRNCVIFWIDVDVGPVNPSMFHTRRMGTKMHKTVYERNAKTTVPRGDCLARVCAMDS